jgi:spermidine synthase
MRDPQYRHTPVAYFCEASGIGHAMRARPPGKPWRVGILGLGAGALAPYGQAGDLFRIYELNPLVLDLAQTQFTYLSDTPAKIEVALGDGRLSLEREPGQQFDLLVMDAFSGDSVPVHLITREAFEIYFRHLRPGGILAVNISNRYLDLQPVMERAADHFGKLGLVFNYTAAEDDFLCNSSSWAVLVEKSAPLPDSLRSGKALSPQPHFRMWTDDFSNMFSILK